MTSLSYPLSLLFKWLGLFFILAMLGSCAPKSDEKVQQTFYVFGTEVQVEIVDTPKDKAQHAIQTIEARFQKFNRDWHAWEPGGIIAKINTAIAQQKPIAVQDSIKTFILKSKMLAAESDYLFDPGIGQLINLWGFHSEDWHGPPPSQETIPHWLASRPSIQDIHFKGNRLVSDNPNVQLDFGGNAKGLALDIAIHSLQSVGIQNAIVNIGGDMRIIGSKNSNQHQAWRIGIQNPKHPGQILAAIQIQGDESIVTSGSYQRYFEWKGKRYSHIINPNTGYPADHFISVTVIHKDATTADAAATALMIAGPKHWQKIARQMHITEAFMIDDQQKTYITPDMAKRLQIIGGASD